MMTSTEEVVHLLTSLQMTMLAVAKVEVQTVFVVVLLKVVKAALSVGKKVISLVNVLIQVQETEEAEVAAVVVLVSNATKRVIWQKIAQIMLMTTMMVVADKAEVVAEEVLVVEVAPATSATCKVILRESALTTSLIMKEEPIRDKEEMMGGHSVEAVAEEAMTTTTGEPLPTTLAILLLLMMLGILVPLTAINGATSSKRVHHNLVGTTMTKLRITHGELILIMVGDLFKCCFVELMFTLECFK